MTENEKLLRVSLEAKELFEVATANRKFNINQRIFSFPDYIDDACFVLLEPDAVLKEINHKTSLLEELLNVKAISNYNVKRESHDVFTFIIEL